MFGIFSVVFRIYLARELSNFCTDRKAGRVCLQSISKSPVYVLFACHLPSWLVPDKRTLVIIVVICQTFLRSDSKAGFTFCFDLGWAFLVILRSVLFRSLVQTKILFTQ